MGKSHTTNWLKIMKNEILDDLVQSGEISSYLYENVDENGKTTKNLIGYRNTERLIITFPSGKVICLNTFCSGCAENTSLEIVAGKGSLVISQKIK